MVQLNMVGNDQSYVHKIPPMIGPDASHGSFLQSHCRVTESMQTSDWAAVCIFEVSH